MNFTTVKTLILWFTGMWAVGLGIRLTLELVLCDGYIHVPRNGINIFFDFVPLAVFGFITTAIGTKELIKRMKKEREVL